MQVTLSIVVATHITTYFVAFLSLQELDVHSVGFFGELERIALYCLINQTSSAMVVEDDDRLSKA